MRDRGRYVQFSLLPASSLSLLTDTLIPIETGLAGLLALKECLSEGLSVQCFEVRTETGGQWAQQPDATADDAVDASAVQSSMYDGVVLNSCRDTSAAPDFPLDPARYGDYFSHRLQLRYMREYAAHFGLDEHIRLGWRVVSCEPRGDGGWVVRVRRVAGEDGKDEIEEEHSFDAVLVCVGHLSTPSTPVFPGRDVFRGQFLHSHYYRRPGPFDRKKVVLVGFGSSAVDIACELAPGAAEVHVVTRRGGWVLPRYVLGKPTEAWDSKWLFGCPTWRGKALTKVDRSCHTGLGTREDGPVAPDQTAEHRGWRAARDHAA